MCTCQLFRLKNLSPTLRVSLVPLEWSPVARWRAVSPNRSCCFWSPKSASLIHWVDKLLQTPSPVCVCISCTTGLLYCRCFKSIGTALRCSLLHVFAFQSESAIVKERELSLELARIRDEVGKWDTVWQIWNHREERGQWVTHRLLHIMYYTV